MSRFISHYDHTTKLCIWTTSPTGIGNYYYKCPEVLGDFGPFDNQPAAMKHYNSVKKTSAPIYVLPPPVVPKENVITVDFVARKRIG